MSLVEQIRDRLWSFLQDEIEVVDAPGGRVECSTLVTYADGDAVSVWIETDGAGGIAVSDFGEGWMRVAGRSQQGVTRRRAVGICERYRVVFSSGSVVALGRLWAAGELIQRVAVASAQITVGEDHGDLHAPESEDPTRSALGFRRLVADIFRERRVAVDTDFPIAGASGKRHKVPIVLPDRELLVAPMPAQAAGSMLSSVFMRFADIGAVNGYQALAVIDDRDGQPPEATVNLLSQVGGTALWSQRQEWMSEVAP